MFNNRLLYQVPQALDKALKTLGKLGKEDSVKAMFLSVILCLAKKITMTTTSDDDRNFVECMLVWHSTKKESFH
jgi:hypothetical protein